MKKLIRTGAVLGAMVLSAQAYAGTLSISSDIDGSEPTFDNPETGATTLTPYDSYEFTVDAGGMYSFLSVYPGDTSIDENMDGFLLLFEGPFDPLSSTSLAFDDDYTAGGIAALAAFDASCSGSNCSGFEAMLSTGTTYVLVQTTFTDTATSFGQPTGPYDLTITGPGDITVVPLPAAAWLMISGLLGLGALRRK